MKRSRHQTKGEKSKRASRSLAASTSAPSTSKRSSKAKAKVIEANVPEADPEADPRFAMVNELLEEEQSSQEDEDLEDEASHRPLSPFQPPPVDLHLEDEENEHPECRNASKDRLYKPGILYLSSIPPSYNVSRTTAFFAQYGKVGRVFLQPDEREKKKSKDGMARNFTEGWIEFMSKGVAKNVAANLNNTPVGGKKRSKAHDVIWNIKYLSKFKWTHLTERLAYEKAVHHQKLRAEISQAKREADHFKQNVDKSKRLKRKLSKLSPNAAEAAVETKKLRKYEFRQKEPDEEVIKKKSVAKRGKLAKAVKVAKAAKGQASVSASKRAKMAKNVFTGVADDDND